MAAVRPPGISDGRVPCPHCGGLIHPVAGRCKHCKEDLSALRAGRPAAAAPLPALVAGSQPIIANLPVPPPNGAPIPVAHEPSQPILPPRPTGRSFKAENPRQGRSMWKSWPMLVIVLASVAIVVAVVLMVWPPSSSHENKRALQPPPAPERMETNPLPPPGQGNSNGADPWGGHSQADPKVAPRQTPDPLPPAAPDPQDDPFAQLQLPNLPNIDLDDVDAQAVAQVCQTFKVIQQTTPTSCADAQKCIQQIDKLCAQTGSLSSMTLMQSIASCTTAIQSC